jgi:hypothetical protein
MSKLARLKIKSRDPFGSPILISWRKDLGSKNNTYAFNFQCSKIETTTETTEPPQIIKS